jgi:hypothetical protein
MNRSTRHTAPAALGDPLAFPIGAGPVEVSAPGAERA